MRFVLALLFVLSGAIPASAQRFVAVAFHDVVDDEKDLGSDSITTGRLIAFFDWLRGNDWHPVSLDDVAAARHGTPLPPRAILLTFDDGDRSAYTRVYPLLLAYHYPAVFALVGAWMDAPAGSTIDYGGVSEPRDHFLSWQEAREMAASGLAEFASHSYDLHRGIRANPQGSMLPTAATWAYDPATGHYESDVVLRARVRRDLERSIHLIQSHLGRTPRTLAWPFGRYSGPAQAAAVDAGFSFVLTLEPEPADAGRPMTIPRLFPSRDPTLNSLTSNMRFADPTPVTRRVVCLSLDAMTSDAAIGDTIEAVRRLGANTLVLDPAAAHPVGSAMDDVWFPTTLRPMKADLLSFVSWQMRTRAGVDLLLRVDLQAASAGVGSVNVPALVRDMVRVAPIDGVLLDPPGNLLSAGRGPNARYPWIVRAARDGIDAATLNPAGKLALDAWHAAVAERPGLRLALTSPADSRAAWPAPAADWLLAAATQGGLRAVARDFAARGWLAPDVTSRVVLPVVAHDEPAAIRSAQVLGATGFGLCPAPSLPAASALSAAFSSATFPRLP